MNQMIYQALYDPGVYNGPKATMMKRPQSAIVTKNSFVSVKV
jgi:hypothetical protein